MISDAAALLSKKGRKMPAKKSSPSLADILSNKQDDKDRITQEDIKDSSTPPVEPEVTEPDPVVEDDDEVIISPDDENGPFANPATSSGNPVLIDRPGISKPVANENTGVKDEKNYVHKWEEDHDQNLGRLHPDVATKPLPAEYAQVAGTVMGIDYANPAEQDDKFPNGREVEDSGYLEDEDAKNDNLTDELI